VNLILLAELLRLRRKHLNHAIDVAYARSGIASLRDRIAVAVLNAGPLVYLDEAHKIADAVLDELAKPPYCTGCGRPHADDCLRGQR